MTLGYPIPYTSWLTDYLRRCVPRFLTYFVVSGPSIGNRNPLCGGRFRRSFSAFLRLKKSSIARMILSRSVFMPRRHCCFGSGPCVLLPQSRRPRFGVAAPTQHAECHVRTKRKHHLGLLPVGRTSVPIWPSSIGSAGHPISSQLVACRRT